MKTCRDCGVDKPLADFYPTKSGHGSYCRPCHQVRSGRDAKLRRQRPEVVEHNRKWQRLRRLRQLGVPEDQLEAIDEEARTGVCRACSAPAASSYGGRLAFDHDHATGKYRGLLCTRCNAALGQVDDDVDRLMALAAYLLQTRDILQEAPA